MSSAPNESAVNVRFYRPGDEEAMLRVLQASFPRWPEVETSVAPIDHLRWKLASGASNESKHTVAEVNGQIVGVRIGLIQRYLVRGQLLLQGMETDSAVTPAFRGRGIYSEVSRFGVKESVGRDFMVSSTGRASLTQADRQLGHRPFGNRLVSLTCHLSDTAPIETAADCGVREVAAFEDRIERFWPQAAGAFEFIAMPSKSELNWRYCDVRGGRGFVFQAEENREVVGFVAGRMSRDRGHIAYLLALPERFDAVRTLVRRAVSYFRSSGFAEAACALPTHHPYTGLLIDEGFTRKSRVIPLTWRTVREGLDLAFLRDPRASIHFMLADTDLI